jgi:deoxycytidylate deaminase
VFFEGENRYRELTGGTFYRSLHAEINALHKAIKTVREYKFKKDKKSPTKIEKLDTIYVVRLMNDNKTKYNLGNCRPCENCQKYLIMYNVKKIKYTDIIDGKNVLCEMRLIR